MTRPTEIGPDAGPDGVRGLLWRRSIYAILIAVSTGMMLARVARVDSSDPKSKTPFLSANDRSRWATIRALGDEGTYVLDDVIFDKKGNRVRGWHTIDLVRHRGSDGQEHYYSSKPTLLTTLLAGEYWLVKNITGATLAEQPGYVSRIMLVLTNVVPMAAALVVLAGLIDRYGTTDWGRIFAVAAACFGTFLTTFSVTLNNHTIAAISLIAAIAVALPIFADDRRDWWRFAVAGLSFGFLAANELPALSLLVFAGLALAWKSLPRTLIAFLPAVFVVAAAALVTNYIAHGDWRTPYAHRKDGAVITQVLYESDSSELNAGQIPASILEALRSADIPVSDSLILLVDKPGSRWVLQNETTGLHLALTRDRDWASSDYESDDISIRKSDNWYDYPGSYWFRKNLRGIDIGETSPTIYAFNCLIGHHGLFSLTPLWLLTVAGFFISLDDFRPIQRLINRDSRFTTQRLIAATALLTTTVILGFYLTRPQLDRNYGGGTCCLRWLIWLTPLWLLAMLPAADWLGKSRLGRALAIGFLAISVFSAAYAADNPWSHPWIFDYWRSMGWISY